jgi:hypothetical protein
MSTGCIPAIGSLQLPRLLLAEVHDAAGHAIVSITSGYLHVAVEDDEVGELFGFATTRSV